MTNAAAPDLGQKFKELSRWKQGLMLAILGAIMGLGQAPFGAPKIALLALALALAMGQGVRGVKISAAYGWAFGFGYFALTMHWIFEPFMVDVARHGWMAPFALIFLAAGLALFLGAAFGGANWLSRGQGPIARLAALVVCLTAAEFARSVVFTGLPWVLIGHIWIGSPLAQIAAYFGPHALTFMSVFLAAIFAAIARKYLNIWWVSLPFLVLVGGHIVLDPGPALVLDEDRPMVRLVQPNAPQDQKWDPDYSPLFQDRLLASTAAEPPVDLVIWPETSIPWLLHQVPDHLQAMGEAARGADVVFGALRLEGELFFNSIVHIGPDGGQRGLHDKAHLVPFGEYIPFGDLLADLGIRGLAARDGGGFGAGKDESLLHFGGGLGTGLALICYEGIFAREVNAHAEDADFLLLITNDAWFGGFAGPRQHFAQARLRSIEQGLPMVRVANTGISGMIDSKGRVLAAIALGEDGYVDARLPPPGAPTLYRRLGNMPVLVLLGMIGLALTLRRRANFD